MLLPASTPPGTRTPLSGLRVRSITVHARDAWRRGWELNPQTLRSNSFRDCARRRSGGLSMPCQVGLAGFEPTTPAFRTQCADQTALQPVRTHTGSRTPIPGFVDLCPIRWTMWVYRRPATRLRRDERKVQGSNLRRCHPGDGLAGRPITTLATFHCGPGCADEGTRTLDTRLDGPVL